MEEQMSRRERKKLQSRNKILDSAVSMFHAKGYQSTSIADIMNEADLGIGTFYNYFTSKDDILLCLLDRMALELEKKVAELQEQKVKQAEVLSVLVLTTAQLIDENRFVLPLFLSAGSGISKNNDGESQLHAPAFMVLFLKLIKEGQATGEFRQDISAGIMVELIHSLFQAAAFSRLSMSFQENIGNKMILLMDGICAKGESCVVQG